MTGDVHLEYQENFFLGTGDFPAFLFPFSTISFSLSLFHSLARLQAVPISLVFSFESFLLALLDGDVAVAKWIRAHYRVSLNVAQPLE